MTYGGPFDFVDCLPDQSWLRLTVPPAAVRPCAARGTTVYAIRKPVNPALLLKLRDSMATSCAPSIS